MRIRKAMFPALSVIGLSLTCFMQSASAIPTLIFAAGGGGGAGYCCAQPGGAGQSGTAGQNGGDGGNAGTGGAGGTAGSGGMGGSSGNYDGGGGAGWLGAGANGTGSGAGALKGNGLGGLSMPSWTGGIGGNVSNFSVGGYGGGGGGGWQGGGGGGGYSGGGGGSGSTANGGGGGSFADGAAQSLTIIAGANGSHTLSGNGVQARGSDGSISIGGTVFGFTGGEQSFTTGTAGFYDFIIMGAQGGQGNADLGGFGASLTASYFLNANETLGLIVGEGGSSGYLTTDSGGGGGGGSFVYVLDAGDIPNKVPEPGTLSLVALALWAGLNPIVLRRRRR